MKNEPVSHVPVYHHDFSTQAYIKHNNTRIKANDPSRPFAGIVPFDLTYQAIAIVPFARTFQATAIVVNFCPEDGSFTITAGAAPELSGCYIASTTSDGMVVYTVSGTSGQSEVVVVPLESDDGNVSRETLKKCQCITL